MESIVIHASKRTDLKLFISLCKRLGLESRLLTDEEKEDIGLLRAMEEGRKSKFVSREEVIRKLRR